MDNAPWPPLYALGTGLMQAPPEDLPDLSLSGSGRSDGLLGTLGQYFENRYQNILKSNEEFRNNPARHIARDALFALNALGVRVPPMTRPLPPTGAAPPSGNYFRPQPLAEPTPGISGMQTYAETMPVLDARVLGGELRRLWGPEAMPYLERNAAQNPAFKPAADHLRRNQSIIDRLLTADDAGPWGMRP